MCCEGCLNLTQPHQDNAKMDRFYKSFNEEVVVEQGMKWKSLVSKFHPISNASFNVMVLAGQGGAQCEQVLWVQGGQWVSRVLDR